MEVKINKFKNIYGIRELKKLEELKGNLIIYAPNGGTKSSLASGFKSISNQVIPNDRIYGRNSEYEFEIDGKIYSNNNLEKIDNLIVYSFDDYYKFSLLDNRDKISTLTVSNTIKEKYQNIYSKVENSINYIALDISKRLGNKKKDNENESIVFEELKRIFKVNSWKEIVKALSNQDWSNNIITQFNYFDIVNEDTLPIIEEKNFSDRIIDLNNKINEKMYTNLFSGQFGSLEADKLYKVLESTYYFDAGHSLIVRNIENPITSLEEFKNLIDAETKKLYGDQEVKTQIESLLSSLNKKKATKKLREIVSDNNILFKLNDIQCFKKELLIGKIVDLKEKIQEVNKIILENEELLNSFINEVVEEKNKWNNIVDLFKSRFNVPFEVSISNVFNTVTGSTLPNFIFNYKEDNKKKEVTEQLLKEILSTGEARALTILYFIFDVEYSIKENLSTFIILDDIVDSFDYKNKYAMMEYLSNLVNTENVISWVLTHNFDFFTTCRSRIPEFTRLRIQATKDGETIHKFGGNICEGGIELFSDWKKKLVETHDQKKLIALLPVVRNIIEFKYGSSCSEYELLSNFLHYRSNTNVISIRDVKNIYKEALNIDIGIDENLKLVQLLETELAKLNTNLSNNIDLDNKLLFSIAIRQTTEKIFNIYDSSLASSKMTLGKEYETVKFNFNLDEQELFNKVIILVPEFIHINSFMYEPLVDIDTTILQEIYRKLNIIYAKKLAR